MEFKLRRAQAPQWFHVHVNRVLLVCLMGCLMPAGT